MPPPTRIYVGNLAEHTTEQDLHDLFGGGAHEVRGILLLPDPKTDRHRGFGFVEMATRSAAEEAVARLDGSMLHGRPMRVSTAPRP